MAHFLKRLRISTKLWWLIVIFTTVGIADNLTELALVSNRLHNEKETQLKHLVETGHSLLQFYEQAVREGRLTDAQARQQAAESIRQLHYGPKEYFWIHDQTLPTPRMVMHPTVPSLNGQILSDPRFNRATALRGSQENEYQKLAASNLFVAMNQVIAHSGDGFVLYDWPKPIASGGVTEQVYPKLSYVKRFTPWGWVIGSGIYIDDLEAEYWRDIKSRLLKAALWVLLLGLLVWFVTRTVVQPLKSFQTAIDDLRANPDHPLGLGGDQPGELGQLTQSFEALIEDLRRSRGELTVSIDKLRLAARSFSNLKEGVVVLDPAGKILSLNLALCRRSGYEAESLIGEELTHLHDERHDEAFHAGLWTSLRESERWQGEIWVRNRSGESFRQWLTLLAVANQHQQIRSYVGLYADPEGSA